MWTMRAILRCLSRQERGFPHSSEYVALVVEGAVSTALHELFGTVFVGPVTVTYPPARGSCVSHPPIVCAIMYCPDRYNEVVSDIPEDVALVVEQGISLALEGRFEQVLVDRVTVGYTGEEGRLWIEIGGIGE